MILNYYEKLEKENTTFKINRKAYEQYILENFHIDDGFMLFNDFFNSDISKPYIKIVQREFKLKRILL